VKLLDRSALHLKDRGLYMEQEGMLRTLELEWMLRTLDLEMVLDKSHPRLVPGMLREVVVLF